MLDKNNQMGLVKKLTSTITNAAKPEERGDLDIDETCGCEVGCGAKRIPLYLCQNFATSRWGLLFLSVGSLVQGFLVNGYTPAVISTVEKRFELTSTESGLMYSCYDIAGVATILFVTYLGGRGHKPLWIGWGIFLIGVSGLVFSLPHFVAPRYAFTEVLNVCGNGSVETCTISLLKNFKYVFYLAMLICGAGASSLTSLTSVYLDENVKQRFSSLYNALFNSMSVLGPGVGFVLAGYSLRLYTYPGEKVSIDVTSDLWVGAWWIGALICGIIGIIASVPVLMLPRVIPGTERHREERRDEIHHAASDDSENPEFGKRLRHFPREAFAVIRNLPFIFLSVGVGFDYMVTRAITTFGAKYIENQYGVEPSYSGIYFGLTVVFGGAGGILAGGWFISHYDISVKGMLHINYIAPLLSATSSLCYLITCSSKVFAGVTAPYHDSPSEDVAGISSPCNADCGCSVGVYSPVCGSDGVTYFSSCFAGCSGQTDGIFTNCSCIAAASYNETDSATATSGACLDERCSSGWEVIVFCFVSFVLVFWTFFNDASTLQVSLRCFGFYRRPLVIGIQRCIGVLGSVPGPIILGALLDRACLQWSEECGTRGSCLAYDNKQVSFYLLFFLIIGKVVDSGLFFLAFLTYKKRAPVEEAAASHTDVEEQPKNVGFSSTNNRALSASHVKVRPISQQPEQSKSSVSKHL